MAEVDWHWNTDLSLVGGLLLLAMAYRLLVGPLRDRIAPEQPFPTASVIWLDLFLVAFYLAVGSPLDDLSDRFLFTAHMVQHVIIMIVLPIMLIQALPPWLVDAAARKPLLGPSMAFWTSPVVAFATFNVVFNAWHVPGAYEWALRDRRVHEAEHLMFLVSAVLMWWPVLSRSTELPRLGWGGRMIYVFLMSVSQIPLFAFLAFSGETYYPTYEVAPRIVPLSPLEDQVLGAVVMKIGGEIAFGLCLVLAFLEWYRREGAPGGHLGTSRGGRDGS